MPTCQSIQFSGSRELDSEPVQEFESLALAQRTKRNAFEGTLPTRIGDPARRGSLAARQDDPYILGQCRNEDLAQPRVDQAKDLE
ncbi:hypothetical protein MesoLjLb_71090 [Mesorhizobium sp. L-8-3]|nr:hypothetical protein MesoLjLb_71090 [Mesorhizobium sp. L-8-3]